MKKPKKNKVIKKQLPKNPYELSFVDATYIIHSIDNIPIEQKEVSSLVSGFFKSINDIQKHTLSSIQLNDNLILKCYSF